MGWVWPLTGRAEELSFIEAAARRTDAPAGIVLAGVAGVGKTRLAREALAAAEQRGVVTRWAVATDSARELPLGAFAAQLGSVGGDPTQVIRQAMEALLAQAGRRGVVVGVDDAHLLDDISALLLHQLVLRRAATVVVTVRTGERAPDAVTALWKDDHLDRLEVQPLSRLETTALLESVLGGPIDTASAGRMWALTQGNALFLRQLFDGETEAGRLREAGGVWRWSGAPGLSPGLAELVTARMGGLSGPIREVIDLLAVGEPLDPAVLAQLSDPAAVEEAESRGLAQVEHDGDRLRARLAHPLYGEARRVGMGVLRARRLRGRVATALADVDGDDVLRRAVLALDSDLPPDPQLLTLAARGAMPLLDLALAARLARAAVAAGGGFEARLTLAYALSWLSEGAEADAELARLTQLVRTEPEHLQAIFLRVGNLFWTLGRPSDAEALLRRAESAITGDAGRHALSAMHAAVHVGLGRPRAAIEAGTHALASSQLPEQAVVLATWGVVGGLGMTGRADAMAPAATRGYATPPGSFDTAVVRFALSRFHMVGLRLAGYVKDAERVADDRRTESTDAVEPLQLYGVVLLGDAALARGRLLTARHRLREAWAGLAPVETTGWLFGCLLSLTQALAMAGAAEAAGRAYDELVRVRHPGFVFLEPEVALARAWVAAAQGAVTEATAFAHEAAEIALSQGQAAHEVLALHLAVCFGDHAVGPRLRELAGVVDGPRAPAAADQAAGLAADDGDGLREVSVRFEEMGDLIAAADAAAQATVAYTRRGLRGAAQAAAARAARLAGACEGARTPALVAALSPLPLTEREREIVTLAAKGLTNREIANRLVVSVRTVEGHLYRASAKLGTTNRAEFAALLRGD